MVRLPQCSVRFFVCMSGLIGFCGLWIPARAQQRIVIREKKQTLPSWITMMEDSTANYNDAVKSFNDYWKNREKPTDENELFEGYKNPSETIKKSSYGKITHDDEEEANIKYSFEYKKFIAWQQEVAPYIQSDGRILAPSERIRAWQSQRRQLNAQLKATRANKNDQQ